MVAETPTERQQGSARGGEPEERLSALVQKLEGEASRRVGRRYNVELRWLEDLQQIHGEYDNKTRQNLAQSKKSRLFINKTRSKTNALEARIYDMVFPTDDKNWAIRPTPVPELTRRAQQTADQARQSKREARNATRRKNANDQDIQQARAKARMDEDAAAKLRAITDEAKKRAEMMSAEMDDQLTEGRYPVEARDVIRDMVRLGSGVMKGPVIDDMPVYRWVKEEAANDQGITVEAYTLHNRADAMQPKYLRVDPWSYFPDDLYGDGGDFERHLWGAEKLRKLARNPNFRADAIRKVMTDKPKGVLPQSIAELRSLTDTYIDIGTEAYIVWEYHGPLTAEDMTIIADALEDEKALEVVADMAKDDEGHDDPLFEVQATVWFCEGQVLYFGIHPLDSGESLYSIVNLEKDETAPWGFGVPYIMRDPQKAMNAAWRAMMNNASISVGPQIVVDDTVVTPADGNWELVGMKVWKKKAGALPNQSPFEIFNIDSHQAELAGIISMASEFIDAETGMPVIMEGDAGTQVQQTAQGMTILQNALNVVFRRIIKNIDDDLTTPCIRRLYHWNMQFSDKEEIKGDYEVEARGSSVLLVREIQAQNLMMILGQFSAHPVLGPITKAAQAYRKLAQSMLLSADEIVMTDEEIQEQLDAQRDAPPDPEVMKLEAQMNLAMMDRDTKILLAQMERDTRMMEYAAKHNITIDQLNAQLEKARMDSSSKERILAAEVAVEERQAARGDQNGSGGYIS